MNKKFKEAVELLGYWHTPTKDAKRIAAANLLCNLESDRNRFRALAADLAEAHRQIAADGTDHLACQVSRDALAKYREAIK